MPLFMSASCWCEPKDPTTLLICCFHIVGPAEYLLDLLIVLFVLGCFGC
jgi:hypothetical protein